jgi:phosphoribosylformylglycinamidine synthase
VVSGNVSLYNEHMSNPIYPTPVVGVVGLLDDASLAVGAGFRDEGDHVFLAGSGPAAIDGSEYQKVVLGEVAGRIPDPDLANEGALHELLAAAASARLLASAHDVSDGGIAVCLAESAIAGDIGVAADIDAADLFTEGEGRAVVSCHPEHADALIALAGDLPLRRIGAVGGDHIVVGEAHLGVADAREIHASVLPRAMGDPE